MASLLSLFILVFTLYSCSLLPCSCAKEEDWDCEDDADSLIACVEIAHTLQKVTAGKGN